MPLRDHFYPPLDDIAAWEEFHGQRPTVIVQHLGRTLPSRYLAIPLECEASYEQTSQDLRLP